MFGYRIKRNIAIDNNITFFTFELRLKLQASFFSYTITIKKIKNE
ncbi:hypothetical protein J2W48_000311 [Flavobacterium piscis]|uniref:Uncharacterized protein n=1 Tax=Flavobacterium piscis TaxID=1114874 RepID=A0ABU1Y404_9FLAO|nr:hypothetical protein [Flavobacterium piscis]